MITVNCSACGGQPQFEESEVGTETVCTQCGERLLVTASHSPGELSAEEQMARYEESLKETDWGHQPC
ncbi:MAG: hypothetical protein VX413_00480 [Verrucomicrobiota bacterium]|nr:hypothetical protein [Verrucomicrobiota bacterium]